MSQCQVCAAKSQLFLCRTDIGKLSEMLTDLPWWLEHLDDAVLGRTRMGDGGKGGTRREPFAGEDHPLSPCRCGHRGHLMIACRVIDPETGVKCACDDYAPLTNQSRLRAQLLAMGRVNARASEQVDAVRNTLTTWVRHLCESRAVTFMPPKSVGSAFVGPLQPGWRRLARDYRPTNAELCEWLAAHVKAIACDEAAGQCYDEIKTLIESIERLVNRPVPWQMLGKCPTWNEHTRTACGTDLRCREGTIEITCPQCRRTHNTAHLKLMMMKELEREKFTAGEILKLNRRLPEDYQISARTLRRWRKPGRNGEPPKLKPCGYRRASDGREVINRHSEDDEPLYRWIDVGRARADDGKVKAV